MLEKLNVEYLVAMGSNSRLLRLAEPSMKKARKLQAKRGGTQQVFGECRYAANTWGHKRRVIVKAEVVAADGRSPRDNPRFVVTNLPYTPKNVYVEYCGRGDMENRIKELYQNTTTILVTHSMEIVRDVADRVIVLKKGELVFDGEPEEGITFHDDMMR